MSQLSEFRIDGQLLAESDALLAAIVRSATDAIIAIDAAGIVVSWNRGAHLHFGFPEREMIGLPVHRFIPPDRMKEQDAALRRVFAGETIGSFRSVRTNRNGRDMRVSVAMSPIVDARGNIVAASAIIRPHRNTKRKESSEQGSLWPALSDDAARTDDIPACRVLVVEEEALTGLGFAAMLDNAGFDVIGPVQDLRSAMTLLDEHAVSLAIIDITLADGETSAPLAERLTRSGIPFLVTTGVAPASTGIFSGAPNLTKPVGARMLVTAVQEALA